MTGERQSHFDEDINDGGCEGITRVEFIDKVLVGERRGLLLYRRTTDGARPRERSVLRDSGRRMQGIHQAGHLCMEDIVDIVGRPLDSERGPARRRSTTYHFPILRAINIKRHSEQRQCPFLTLRQTHANTQVAEIR